MMTKDKLGDLQTEGQKHIADAREIAEKQDGEPSEWPTDVRDSYNAAMAKAADTLEKIKTARHDLAVMAEAKAIADDIGLPPIGDPTGTVADGLLGGGGGRKSLGRTIIDSPEFKAMLSPYTHGGEIQIPKGTHVNSAPINVGSLRMKTLITGVSRTSGGTFLVPDRTDIVEMLGRAPLVLDDLISHRATASDVVEFVQETSHTNAATPVAEATTSAAPTAPGSAGPLVPAAGGGYKPEGAWAFKVVQATVKTIAEWVPITKRALADVSQLEGLINDELQKDLKDVREAQMLNGDGAGEDLQGITTTTGIQTQAFATDIFTSVRNAITKLRTIGRVNPNAILLNPADSATVDLTKDLQGRYYYGGPQALGPKTLWGLPIVESEYQALHTSTVGDFSKAVTWDRQQSTVTMTDSHADFFVRNLVAVLAEERMAFAVTRPLGFCIVTLQ
jgi:HK97 family phage major capsid protein